MLAAAILIVSAVFYFGTVGVLDRGIDANIMATSHRLIGAHGARPVSELAREIDREVGGGADRESAFFLVTSASGRRLAGNLTRWPEAGAPHERLVKRQVVHDGKPASARLIIRELPDGGLLYVGRDVEEEDVLRRLVWRALTAAAFVAFLLAIFAALLFRRQIETRISEIRDTANQIEAGNLMSRIKVSGDDEFARLGIDINRMLDRIEQLVEGVRHVSNAIAHDLRTPLADGGPWG